MESTNPTSTEETTAVVAKAPPVKKIKIIVSDLHLGKGRLLKGGGLNSLEEFYFGEKLVEFIHFYSTGAFRDYEVELIINGDFLNFLQCDYRGHFLTVITESMCLEIMREIVEGHKNVFNALAEFAAKPGNSITYVVGNHDQGMLWPACRAYLNQVIGTPIRYKNIVYFFDGVHVEHGHMHEAANRMDPKKFFLKKNLAEPILNLPFGSHFFVEVVLKIKQQVPHVDKIRPFGKMVRWAFVNETKFMIKGFLTAMGYFVRSSVGKDPRRNWSLKRIIQVVLESAIFPDLSESARRILNDDRVHTVIFGHSHVYQYRQWSENKEYFNTGTWTELTSLDIVSLGKITKLTYVLIEYPEDGARPRGRLKEWKGYHRIEEDVAIS
ncbi:Calcineurin-like phosphoesterase superfamily domain protein [compost metagenome]